MPGRKSRKLDASGEQMTIWVDGNKLISSTDPRLQLGRMELIVLDNAMVWLDDVKVWESGN